MDWSRAKTILIIVFVILDLFLAAQINYTIEEKSLFIQTGTITNSQIQKLLKDNHVRLTAEPQEITAINPFVAQISSLSTDWTQDEKGNYTKNFPEPIALSEATLQKHIPYFHSYHKTASQPGLVVYLQYENNTPLFDAKLNLFLTKDQKIRSIQILHYQAKMMKKINLISFNHALYNLLYSDELSRFSNPTITKVILGYRARSNPNQTTDYYLMPYWRFVMEEGPFVDVNALNGIVETPEKS